MALNLACTLFICVILPTTWGHLCLLNPHQRGSMMGLNKAGSNDCFLIKGPCGDRGMSKSVVYFKSGMNYTITFQKNLNHWTKAMPGYFSIELWTSGLKLVKELARVKDNGEPSLHIYNIDVNMPKMNPGLSVATNTADLNILKLLKNGQMGTYILQVTYVTNNPQAPKAFFQCADIGLVN